MTPWLGNPTSYASGYMSAHRTAADSQSLTCAFSSPPTYCTGFETRGSSGSRSGNIDGVVMFAQGSPAPVGATPRPVRAGDALAESAGGEHARGGGPMVTTVRPHDDGHDAHGRGP